MDKLNIERLEFSKETDGAETGRQAVKQLFEMYLEQIDDIESIVVLAVLKDGEMPAMYAPIGRFNSLLEKLPRMLEKLLSQYKAQSEKDARFNQ